ncbi:hypothetical protein LTS10_004450 [Elasticomyces elasticus]|nr:hypothetical protein LTS10_004450 [Elasticomyces elasticus]
MPKGLTPRTTTARVSPLAHLGPVPNATHQPQGYYTILRPDANYLQHPPRINAPYAQYPGPHPQAPAAYSSQYAAFQHQHPGPAVYDPRYGLPPPQAPAAQHPPFDPNFDYVAAAQRAHLAYTQTASPYIVHPVANPQIQPQQAAYGAVPQAPAVYQQAEQQQQQNGSQRFAVPVKTEQFTPQPSSAPRYKPVLQQVGAQVMARQPLANLPPNAQQQVPNLQKRPGVTHEIAHTIAEERQHVPGPQQAQSQGIANPQLMRPAPVEQPQRMPQTARPNATAAPPVNSPGVESSVSEDSEDIEEEEPLQRERDNRHLAVVRPRATSVNGSMRHTFKRADQDSVSYLLRMKCITGLMPEPIRILSVPSTTSFHQLHLIIQTAMDYTNSHLYKFKVSRLRHLGERWSWPDDTELMSLVERWSGERDYLHPSEMEKVKLTREVKLWQIYENAAWRAKGIVSTYTYDFGSEKTFEIHFMGQADNMLGKAIGKRENQDIACLAGEGGAIHEVDDSAPRPRPYKWDMNQVNKDLKKLQRLKVYKDQIVQGRF